MKWSELHAIAKKRELLEKSRVGASESWMIDGKAVSLYESIWACVGYEFDETHDELKPLASWRHRQREEIRSDLGRLVFLRGVLKDLADEYLSLQWARSPEMTWFLCEVLIYAELVATLNSFSDDDSKRQAIPRDVLVVRKASPKYLNKKIAIVFFGAILSAFLHSWAPIVVMALVLWTYEFYLNLLRGKVTNLLESMIETYALISTPTTSWRLLWDSLVKSKSLGAVWDTQVYALVESNYSTPHA